VNAAGFSDFLPIPSARPFSLSATTPPNFSNAKSINEFLSVDVPDRCGDTLRENAIAPMFERKCGCRQVHQKAPQRRLEVRNGVIYGSLFSPMIFTNTRWRLRPSNSP
jgi:hypothetical protein